MTVAGFGFHPEADSFGCRDRLWPWSRTVGRYQQEGKSASRPLNKHCASATRSLRDMGKTRGFDQLTDIRIRQIARSPHLGGRRGRRRDHLLRRVTVRLDTVAWHRVPRATLCHL